MSEQQHLRFVPKVGALVRDSTGTPVGSVTAVEESLLEKTLRVSFRAEINGGTRKVVATYCYADLVRRRSPELLEWDWSLLDSEEKGA